LKDKLKGYTIKKAFIYKQYLYIITQDNEAKEIILEKNSTGFETEIFDLSYRLYKNLIVEGIYKEDKKIYLSVKGDLKDIIALEVPIYYDTLSGLLLDITNNYIIKKELQPLSIDIHGDFLGLTQQEKDIIKKFGFYVYSHTLYYGNHEVKVRSNSFLIDRTIKVIRDEKFEERLKKAIIKLGLS